MALVPGRWWPLTIIQFSTQWRGRRIHCCYLNQQSDGAALVHFQDFTVLGPYQDVAVAKRYGTYGGVVLQEQPCGATLSRRP